MSATTPPQTALATVEACRQWLMVTPLSNAAQALPLLLHQLNLLNRQTLEPLERLTILDLLRKRTLSAQEEGAVRFVGKPLPLVPPEQTAFDTAQAIWQALLRGYGHCLEGELATGTVAPERMALLIQRAFATLAAAQYDIYRSGFQPGAGHWQALHELYAMAERSHAAEIEVDDTLRHGKTKSSPASVYIEMLLLHAASPHELAARHMVWVARWARRWARKARILATAPALDSESIPLYLDLGGDLPASYVPAGGPSARWIDTTEIRRSLRKRLSLLDKGTAPAELQLGDDCQQPACGQILKHVYQRWCRGGTTRKQERRLASGGCEVVAGIDAIYVHVSNGRTFRQPGTSDDNALRRERDEMAIFGSAPRNLGTPAQPIGRKPDTWNVVEEWDLADESATGLHVARGIDAVLERVSQRQLVAVKPPAAQSMLMGNLRWRMVTADARLHVGIQIFPGRPEAVSVRPHNSSGIKEPFRPAFLLPAVPAIGSPTSVITPSGYFRAGRLLEVTDQPFRHIRLLQLLDRGIDFDRISYEPVT